MKQNKQRLMSLQEIEFARHLDCVVLPHDSGDKTPLRIILYGLGHSPPFIDEIYVPKIYRMLYRYRIQIVRSYGKKGCGFWNIVRKNMMPNDGEANRKSAREYARRERAKGVDVKHRVGKTLVEVFAAEEEKLKKLKEFYHVKP